MSLPKPDVDVLFGTAYSAQTGKWKVCVQVGGVAHYGPTTYDSEQEALDAMADLVDLSTVIVDAVANVKPALTERLEG